MKAKRLGKYRRRLYDEKPLIGGWLRHRAMESLIKDGSHEAMRALEEAALRNSDKMQFEIVAALRQMAEQGNVEAQESLCRLVIFHDLLLAREAALAIPCAPRDASQRALFYFLIEQWDKYESLDFDHSLLRAAHEAADEKLRQRIGERARRAGRLEWVEVAMGGRLGRRLGGMTDKEWEVTLEVLSGSGRWAEMWRLAQEAPARWSAQILQRVSSVRWVPDGDGERAGYEELALLAKRWTGAWLGTPVRCRAELKGHNHSVTCLAINPDGRMLASGGRDNKVRLWSLPGGLPLQTLEGHSKPINCLAISPNGRAMASGSDDGTVRLWSLPDGTPLDTLKEHRGRVTRLAISLDGRVLASGGDSDRVRLWSLPDGVPLQTLEVGTFHNCLAFDPDGWMLVSGSDRGAVQLWGLPSGARLKTLIGHEGTVCCLAINPDGRVLASGSRDKTVRLWSLPDGTPLKTLKGHTNWVTCLAISPDGRVLASGGDDKTVRLWSLPDGVPLQTLEGHSKLINCLAINPDGQVLASGSRDETVRLWSLPDGELLRTLEGHTDTVRCLAISPDGQVLASGSGDETVRLWVLDPLSRLPIGQTTLEDFSEVQKTLRDGNLPAEERSNLEFIAALMRWRRRSDIILGEAPRRIEVGEFDIEIEG